MPLLDRYFEGNPLELSPGPHLFIDDYLVEDRWGLDRVLQQPEKHLRNPVLVRDRPWEGDLAYRPCVIDDPERGCFRMWYQCFSSTNYFGAGGPPYHLCYAESDDGFNWNKPLMDVCPYPGHDGPTNVVYCGTHRNRVQGVQVWRDEEEADAARRYKMICVEARPHPGDGALQSGVELCVSPDGLQWTLAGDRPILDYHSDCFNHAVRDPGTGRWLLYCRPIHMSATGRREPTGQTGRRHTRRRISVMASRDFSTWSYPRVCMYPDERDTPDYDSCRVFAYAGQLLMLYAAMEGDHTGTNEARLASSRDGLHWERYHTREAFLGRGRGGDWDAGQVIPDGPVESGGLLLFYYSGTAHPQYDSRRNGGIGVASLRPGQLVSQEAGDRPGYLLTREVVLDGSELRLNTLARGLNYAEQWIRVEIARRPELGGHRDHGQAIEGFELEACDPLHGTRTDAPVTWAGNGDLSSLAGKPVYLRFEVKNMGLCGFEVAG